MKYIYILGLEHSGTTLTDHMLSAHPRVTGVGEVAQFFSVDHMRHYLRKWGELDDHDVCSCGQRWSECELWQAIVHLNGAESQLGKVEKQKALISHHIEMGNKGFTMRNRSVIKYDSSWVKYPWLRIAYMCHWKARNLYRLLERGF